MAIGQLLPEFRQELHLARTTFVLLALAALPGFAQPRAAAVYPISGPGVAKAQLDDVEGMVKAAILRSRDGAFTLPELRPLPLSCGPAQTARPACLAKLAGAGVVLRGVARVEGRRIGLTLDALDGKARSFGPVRIAVDPAIEDLRPVVAAIEELGRRVGEGRAASPRIDSRAAVVRAPAAKERRAAIPAAVPPAAAAPVATTTPPSAARSAAPLASLPAVQAAPEPSQGAWMAPTGKWLLVGGAVALASGGAAGYLGKRLSDDLASKYAAHTLTPADSGSYGAAQRYSLVANSLFVAGGALALTGLTIWGLAPDVDADGVTHLSGRF